MSVLLLALMIPALNLCPFNFCSFSRDSVSPFHSEVSQEACLANKMLSLESDIYNLFFPSTVTMEMHMRELTTQDLERAMGLRSCSRKRFLF